MFKVQMFGSLVVDCGERQLSGRDFGGVKPKHLLEVLLINRGRAVTKDELADALWGDRLPRDQVATLEAYVSVLRTRLQPGAARRESIIITEPGAYRLDTSKVEVDLDEFDRLVMAAGSADRLHARQLLLEACDLVHGEVLEDRRYADCVQPLREHYRVEHVEALVRAAALFLTEPVEATEALRLAERSLAVDPLNEAAYRIVMKAANLIGRRDIAIRTYDRCAHVLATELNVEPSGATTALRDTIANETLPAPKPVVRPLIARLPIENKPALGKGAMSKPLSNHRCSRRRSVAPARPRHSVTSRNWPQTG